MCGGFFEIPGKVIPVMNERGARYMRYFLLSSSVDRMLFDIWAWYCSIFHAERVDVESLMSVLNRNGKSLKDYANEVFDIYAPVLRDIVDSEEEARKRFVGVYCNVFVEKALISRGWRFELELKINRERCGEEEDS